MSDDLPRKPVFGPALYSVAKATCDLVPSPAWVALEPQPFLAYFALGVFSVSLEDMSALQRYCWSSGQVTLIDTK